MATAGILARAGAAAMAGARRSRTAELLEQLEAPALWTPTGSPALTPELDPFGGQDAVNIFDDDTQAFEYISTTTTTSLVSGRRYKITHYVKKDDVPSRFPEIQHMRGSGFAYVQIGTVSGAVVVRAQSGWTGVSAQCTTAPENSEWWCLTVRFTPNSDGLLTVHVNPAGASSLGGAPQPGLTGSITYFSGALYEV